MQDAEKPKPAAPAADQPPPQDAEKAKAAGDTPPPPPAGDAKATLEQNQSGREHRSPTVDQQRRAANPQRAGAHEPEPARGRLERPAVDLRTSFARRPTSRKKTAPSSIAASRPSSSPPCRPKSGSSPNGPSAVRLDAAAEQRTRTIDLLPAQQADDRRHDDPVRHPDQRRRLQRPLHRRHGQHQRHDAHPFTRSQAAGPAGLRPAARRPAPLQRQRPRSRRRQVRLLHDGLLRPGDRSSGRSVQYRYLLTMQDVTRASRSPSPTPRRSSTPTPSGGEAISEKRIKRYGKAVDLFDRDAKTKKILEKLDEPISMSFAEETPARRRAQVHQAGDHDRDAIRASRSTSIRSACRRPRSR